MTTCEAVATVDSLITEALQVAVPALLHRSRVAVAKPMAPRPTEVAMHDQRCHPLRHLHRLPLRLPLRMLRSGSRRSTQCTA